MEKYLNFEDFIKLIKELSKSQGLYGRILREINELNEEELEKLKTAINKKHFKDNIDIILWIEE